MCRLQDEHTRAQSELKRLLGDRQVAQEKQQLLLAELRGELLDKTRELEELRLQVHISLVFTYIGNTYSNFDYLLYVILLCHLYEYYIKH